MTKYLKITANPDSSQCRCTSGDPDCDHFEFCPECGTEYKEHEGHDCLDSYKDGSILATHNDVVGMAKELRDALDACETERDKAVKSLQKAGYTDCGGELWKPPIGPSASPLLEEIDRLRAQIAALKSVPQGVEVPELTDDDELDALKAIDLSVITSEAGYFCDGMQRGYKLAVSRLVPTPPQADAVVVSREEWETLNAFLEDWRAPESRSLHDWNTSLKAKAARINALRTSAQAHNGEESK